MRFPFILMLCAPFLNGCIDDVRCEGAGCDDAPGTDGGGGHGGNPALTATSSSGVDPVASSVGAGPEPNCGPWVCAANEYCYDIDDECGTDPLSESDCTPAPTSCNSPSPPDHVCGCDGKVYDNECVANAAGVAAGLADCPVPPGTVRCGKFFCDVATSFCVSRLTGQDIGKIFDYFCEPIPEPCASAPTCECILAEQGIDWCDSPTCTSDSAFFVDC